MLPLIVTEEKDPESGEYASVLAAKRSDAWVQEAKIIAKVTKESFTSTESDDIGKALIEFSRNASQTIPSEV